MHQQLTGHHIRNVRKIKVPLKQSTNVVGGETYVNQFLLFEPLDVVIGLFGGQNHLRDKAKD